MWLGFAAYLGVLAAAPRLGGRVVWAAIVVVLVSACLVPPLLSHDVYSYVDYARLGVLHGLDPYVHPPAAVPTDAAYASVTWIDAPSAYGPLFTLLTYPLAPLPVDVAVAALKVLAGASVLALAAVLSRIAPARGVEPLRASAFVALNPLVVVHVAGGAHNDGLAVLLATVGVGAMLAGREIGAGAAFVAAFAIKAPAAIAAPFALVDSARLNPPLRRFLAGGVVAGLAIAVAACAAFGWHWLDALGLAGENQSRTSHMSIPVTAARLTGLDPDALRIAALALFAVAFLYLLERCHRGADWIRTAAWAALGLLLATAWLLPWYLIWALPLAALSRDRTLQLLTLALTAYQLAARIPL